MHNGGNCLTLVQFYSQDFWTQSSLEEKLLGKRENKAFLKKYLWVLVFEVLVSVVLAFEVLAFEVLAFEVLVFEVLVFEVLDLRS